jgi:hypothetical protein
MPAVFGVQSGGRTFPRVRATNTIAYHAVSPQHTISGIGSGVTSGGSRKRLDRSVAYKPVRVQPGEPSCRISPYQGVSPGTGINKKNYKFSYIATALVGYLSEPYGWTDVFVVGAVFAIVSAAAWLFVNPTWGVEDRA